MKSFQKCGEITGGALKLAPNLSFPSSKSTTNSGVITVTGINAVGSLTTALSLVGKFSISFLSFAGLTNEPMTFKLTVDGVVIWNDSSLSAFSLGTLHLIGEAASDTGRVPETIICDSSFLLEVQTTADADIGLSYLARPIL